jgi:FtsP/CotA-like multicopper oxidase with cupredoxin domain
MILVNGQFPGPTLEINQGDEVEVRVHNKMPLNTTVHFHGIEMHLTPWSDGVPGVTQRHIQPGGSFNYKWTATQYGSYWYHAHQSGQLDDGLYGAIIIRPSKHLPTPFNLITTDKKALKAIERAAAKSQSLMVSDFRHTPSQEIIPLTKEAGIELTCYDSVLFNGKGSTDCWSSEYIASLLSPEQKTYLQLGNATSFTPKGCLPGEVLANVFSAGFPTNLSAVPSDILDTCIPSNGAREVIHVTKMPGEGEKWIALDVIGTFGLLTVSFSIDGLPMHVYAVDGEYIEPQLVQAITVTNGDRFSVLVRLTDAQPGDYPIRIASVAAIQLIAGSATLSYHVEEGDVAQNTSTPTRYIQDNGLPTSPSVTFFNQTAQRQFNPPEPFSPAPADQTFVLHMKTAGNSYSWALNSTSIPASVTQEDHSTPSSPDVILFSPQPNIHNNVTITTQNNTWVDLIFVTAVAPQPPHPIHKHGNKMWLLGAGTGEWTWSSVAEAAKELPEGTFNLVDPPRRDSFATLPALAPGQPTWTAVRYHVTQPGAWFIHCHIQSHLLGGMGMVIQDGVDQWPVVPEDYLAYR